MKHKLAWQNEENTILRQIYSDNIATNDILEMARVTYELLSTVPHTVHLFIELTSLSRNAQKSFMEAAENLDATVAPNQGYVFVIGGGLAMLYTGKAVGLSAPKATQMSHFVESVEEAQELLKRLTSA